jgi:hypothetical protein
MVVDGQITKNQFLTKSTTEGLRVTILSTIQLSQCLLSCGFHYVLSNKFNHVQYVLDSDTKKSQIKKSMRENSGKIDLLIGKTDTNKENEEFDNDMIFHSLD